MRPGWAPGASPSGFRFLSQPALATACHPLLLTKARCGRGLHFPQWGIPGLRTVPGNRYVLSPTLDLSVLEPGFHPEAG